LFFFFERVATATMLRHRLREANVATHLGRNPKTVRPLLKRTRAPTEQSSRVGRPVGADEADLWPKPEVRSRGSRPESFRVYPTVGPPRDVRVRFFESASVRSASLPTVLCSWPKMPVYSASSRQARSGVRVRLVPALSQFPCQAGQGKIAPMPQRSATTHAVSARP